MSSRDHRNVVRVVNSGGDPEDPENWTEIDSSEAVHRLLSGNFELAVDFERPPTALLPHLSTALGQTHLIGPSALGGNAFEKIGDHVLRNGVRQQIVDGREINWAKDKWEALSLVAAIVWKSSPRDADLLGQLVRLHDRHTTKCGEFSHYKRAATSDEMREHNLVRPFNTNPIETTIGPTYAKVDSDWCAFYFELRELFERIESTMNDALRDARVVVVEEIHSTARVVAPSRARTPKGQKTRERYFCCATADLPKTWFKSDATLKRDRKRATQFAEFAFQYDWGRGRRPSVTDVKSVICERMFLTPNAAKEAWGEVDKKYQGRSGNIAGQERVSYQEINGLYDNWRER